MAAIVRVDTSDLSRTIQTLESNAKHLDRCMPAVAEMLVSAVEDVYDAEGPGWEPLAATTLERRRGTSAKILQDTGLMVGSTQGSSGANWAQAAAHVPYAKYHATGTRRIPKRNPFELGKFEADVLDDVANLLSREVVK